MYILHVKNRYNMVKHFSTPPPPPPKTKKIFIFYAINLFGM